MPHDRGCKIKIIVIVIVNVSVTMYGYVLMTKTAFRVVNTRRATLIGVLKS